MSDYQTNAGESSKRKILILFRFVAFFFLYIRVQLLDSGGGFGDGAVWTWAVVTWFLGDLFLQNLRPSFQFPP